MIKMKSEVISKFAKKILSCDDLGEAISVSSFQFRYLAEDDDLATYFSLVSESNLISSSLIYFYFINQHKASMPKVDDILVDAIRRQSLLLDGDKINLQQKANITQAHINDSLHDIKRIADLCISNLLVNSDSSLDDEIFYKNVKRIRIRTDSYGFFLNRCGELLSHLDNRNRCIYTIKLIDKMRYYCNNENNSALALVLKSLSNRALHFYGEYSSNVLDYIKSLYALNDPFVMLQTLELFPQINFTLLSINLSDYLKLAEKYSPNNDYAKNLIQTIACAEIMNSRENSSLSEHDLYKFVCQQYKKALNKNEALKRTLALRFICKSIVDYPNNFDSLIVEFNSSEELLYRTLVDVENDAFNALVRDNPTKVTKYLKWLDNANVYKLNYSVRSSSTNYSIRIPGMMNIADFCNSQVERLSKYCSIDDLVYIYFNSCIRVYMPIEELMKIAYKKSPKKRDDYMNVKNPFGKYIINGFLSFDDKQTYRFSTKQFCTLSPYLAVSGYERISDQDINRIKTKNNGEVQFAVEACNVAANFRPIITLIDRDKKSNLVKNKKANIKYYSDYLDKIAKKRTYNANDILVLSDMPQHLTTYSDYILLGMSLIRSCCFMNNNLKTVKFLEQIGSNPFRIDSENYSFVPTSIDIKDEDFVLCSKYINRLIGGNGALEDWLYIYFNTIMKSVFPFDVLLQRLEVRKKKLELWTLYDAYGILLHGKIDVLDETYVSIRPISFNLSETWKIICPLSDETTNYKKSDVVIFGLYSVDKDKKIIYAEKMSKTFIRNTRFCLGMNKAKLTLELDANDIRNLHRIPSELNRYEYNKLATDELEAIKFRLSNIKSLKSFLSLIQDANPWTFSEHALPCLITKSETTDYLIKSTVNDLVDNCSLEFVVSTYFNTSIKSGITIDEIFYLLFVKYKDINRIVKAFSPYKLCVFGRDEKTRISSNMYLNSYHFKGLNNGKYSVVGYDREKKNVRLEAVEIDSK